MLSPALLILFILYGLATLLHTLGAVLVSRFIRKRTSPFNKGQYAYLLFLIVVEFLGCSGFLIDYLVFYYKGLKNEFAITLLVLLRSGGITIMYVGAMILLTIDRVLVISLASFIGFVFY